MQKVIIDTHVIVSALTGSGFPRHILYHLVFERKIIVSTSDEVFQEYIEVLNRKKFRRYPEFTNVVLIIA